MEKVVWAMSFKVKILKSSPLAMDDSEYAAAEAATFADSEDDARAPSFLSNYKRQTLN